MGGVKSHLFTELCRAFNAKDRAMLCALSHGQVVIDGFVVRVEHLDRWTPDQLRGRYAHLAGRCAQLYGQKVVGP